MNFLSEDLTPASSLISTFGTVNKSLLILSACVLVGVLLSFGFLLIEHGGKLQSSAMKLRKFGVYAAGTWLLTSFLEITITLANILDSSLGEALEPTTFRSFITQVDLGRFLFAQTIAAAIVLIGLRFITTALQSIVFLAITLVGLVAPVFQSHSAAAGSHALAIGSLVVHVIALSLWVGGLCAIALLADADRRIALPRFSQLALWAAIAVVISGVTNAWSRLDFAQAWSTSYARIVIAKAILTLLVVVIAFQNRRKLARGVQTGWSLLSRVIAYEVLLMGVIVILGSWLSKTEPPVGAEVADSPAIAIVGFPAPAQPNFARILTVYDPDAPTGSGWWHWVVYNIPANTIELGAGAGDISGQKLPAGALQGRTDFGTYAFGGACPPEGEKPHRYIFTVYALQIEKIEVQADSTAAMIGFMINSNAVDKASFTATFGR